MESRDPLQHHGTPNSTVTGTPFNITGPPTQLYMDPQEKEGGEMWGHGTPTTRTPPQLPPTTQKRKGKKRDVTGVYVKSLVTSITPVTSHIWELWHHVAAPTATD